jgi:hypothetical protein
MSGSATLVHSHAVRDILCLVFRPLLVLIFILLVCCTQFELIVRPRLARAFNDVLICPRCSPIPTQRGPPTHAVRREQSVLPHSFAD